MFEPYTCAHARSGLRVRAWYGRRMTKIDTEAGAPPCDDMAVGKSRYCGGGSGVGGKGILYTRLCTPNLFKYRPHCPTAHYNISSTMGTRRVAGWPCGCARVHRRTQLLTCCEMLNGSHDTALCLLRERRSLCCFKIIYTCIYIHTHTSFCEQNNTLLGFTALLTHHNYPPPF